MDHDGHFDGNPGILSSMTSSVGKFVRSLSRPSSVSSQERSQPHVSDTRQEAWPTKPPRDSRISDISSDDITRTGDLMTLAPPRFSLDPRRLEIDRNPFLSAPSIFKPAKPTVHDYEDASIGQKRRRVGTSFELPVDYMGHPKRDSLLYKKPRLALRGPAKQVPSTRSDIKDGALPKEPRQPMSPECRQLLVQVCNKIITEHISPAMQENARVFLQDNEGLEDYALSVLCDKARRHPISYLQDNVVVVDPFARGNAISEAVDLCENPFRSDDIERSLPLRPTDPSPLFGNQSMEDNLAYEKSMLAVNESLPRMDVKKSPIHDVTIKSPARIAVEKSPVYDVTDKWPARTNVEKSPVYDVTDKSPACIDVEKSPVYDVWDTPPARIPMEKSPIYDLTDKSPARIPMEKSPIYDLTDKSPACIPMEKSPVYAGKDAPPACIDVEKSPQRSDIERPSAPIDSEGSMPVKSPEPADGSPKNSDQGGSFWELQIKAVYARRNPKKLATLDALLEKHKNNLTALFVRICRQYDLDTSKNFTLPSSWGEEKDMIEDEEDQVAAQPTIGNSAGGSIFASSIFGKATESSIFGKNVESSVFGAPESRTTSIFGTNVPANEVSGVPSIFGTSTKAPEPDSEKLFTFGSKDPQTSIFGTSTQAPEPDPEKLFTFGSKDLFGTSAEGTETAAASIFGSKGFGPGTSSIFAPSKESQPDTSEAGDVKMGAALDRGFASIFSAPGANTSTSIFGSFSDTAQSASSMALGIFGTSNEGGAGIFAAPAKESSPPPIFDVSLTAPLASSISGVPATESSLSQIFGTSAKEPLPSPVFSAPEQDPAPLSVFGTVAKEQLASSIFGAPGKEPTPTSAFAESANGPTTSLNLSAPEKESPPPPMLDPAAKEPVTSTVFGAREKDLPLPPPLDLAAEEPARSSIFGTPAKDPAASSIFGTARKEAQSTSMFATSVETTQAPALEAPLNETLATSTFAASESFAFGAPTAGPATSSIFGASGKEAESSAFGIPATARPNSSIFGTTTKGTESPRVEEGAETGPVAKSTEASASISGAPAKCTETSIFGAPAQGTGASIFGAPAQGTGASIFGTPATGVETPIFGTAENSEPPVFGNPARGVGSDMFGTPPDGLDASQGRPTGPAGDKDICDGVSATSGADAMPADIFGALSSRKRVPTEQGRKECLRDGIGGEYELSTSTPARPSSVLVPGAPRKQFRVKRSIPAATTPSSDTNAFSGISSTENKTS